MDDIIRSLTKAFGSDKSKWPKVGSKEYITWSAKNRPTYGPETKTAQELLVELEQARQTLNHQRSLSYGHRTMNMIDCEAGVNNLLVRLERLRMKDEY